ncbi:hotdog fold thioesterase [Paracrocinitomix mangrovi]|uniref:PaaI family thioesterase n=1 Tax=Paracrocinitomix mangrovi TaxID=2862509 RepID=UPI001C8E2C70|nr:hotdog fold thioesterase [Paracrocinitomix mangrovi]UKN03128.1 hotdog fold thioesterase [Paracrocinitomix mangrovi]
MALLPKEIIDKMMASDEMSQWLGITVLDYTAGAVSLKMTVRKEMTNGFGVTHGGITYSLADSALAFSSNSHGMRSMSIETSISHLAQVNEGDILTVKSRQLSLSRKIGVYEMDVYNQDNKIVAHFKGTVYRSSIEWK